MSTSTAPARARTALPSADVLLTDGSVVTIRPICESDAPGVGELYRRTAQDSLRLRFFTYSPRAGQQDIDRMLRPAAADHDALVAVQHQTVIGVGCIEPTNRPRTAEFALLVDDRLHGHGVGMLLLEQMISAARLMGYRRLCAEVLAENSAMLHVLRDLGAQVRQDLAHAVVDVEFPIAEGPAFRLAVADRESIAEHASLERILAPQSIVVVGAGRAGVGHRIMTNLIESGFTGDLHAVNQSGIELNGIATHSSLDELPSVPDLAVIAVPATDVPGVIEDCARIGVYGAVIVSDGFAEQGAGGHAQQATILATARQAGMRLIGPSCLGIVNTDAAVRMNATFATSGVRRGVVGLASQSGAVGVALLDYLTRRRIGLSTFVSLGNKADVSGNDLLMYWERDSATKVCVLYLESFGNARKFARVARRLARKKPVVVVTAGGASRPVRGAQSHAASAATPAIAMDALFAQAGVMRADNLSEVMDVVSVLTDAPLPAGRRVAIVTNGSGSAALAADACAAAGLLVPEVSTSVRCELARLLPQHATTANPVDITTTAPPGFLAAASEALMRSADVDAVMVVHTSLGEADTDAVAAGLARVAGERNDKPLLGVFLGQLDTPAPLQRPLAGAVIPCFAFPEAAATALGIVATYADWRRAPEPRPPALRGMHRREAAAIADAFLREHPDGGWLDSDAAAALVGAFGVPVVDGVRAESPSPAVAAATALGYPVVVKTAAGAVVHRSEVGGVRLDLATPQAVAEAVAGIKDSCGDDCPVLVQPMVSGGVETAIGIVNDPAVGPVVMLALGGITTDLLADRSFRLPPLSRRLVRKQIEALRAAPLLFGYRGTPPVDVAALEDVLLRVGQLATDLPQLAELDLNPVIVSPQGAVAVDVKVRLAPPTPVDPFQRRLSPRR
ncbi:MAG TPA: GNAT family N-acetyltransferase [Mycobacteriales bacterium]|nr:GNAT family N-acetyltransferase [Mycobacteriales bacterium]